MSFDSFKFKFNPPPTVPDPTRVDVTELGGPPTLQTAATRSQAGRLINQLSGLADTAKYLRDAIVGRFSATGMEIDLSANPDIGAALGRIYGTDSPPSLVTIPMLANMLDAEATITQMEIGLGLDSPLQPNPVQVADLNLVTTTVEGLLIQTGQFQYQLPTLLRSLQADQIVAQNWQASLQQYPVYRAGPVQPLAVLGTSVIPARSLDVSDNVVAVLSGWADKNAANYSSMYQFLAGVSSVDQTIVAAVNVFVAQPVQDVVRVVSLLQGLKGLFHKNALQDSADILTTFVFARMASDLGGMMMILDRYVHMAVDPLKGATAQLGHLMSTIQQATAMVGTVAHGGVPGLPVGNPCSQRPHAVNSANSTGKTIQPPAILNKIPQALQVLGQHLDWATHLADSKNLKVQESLQKLLNRKNKQLGDKLDTMCSLQSLDTLISLAQGVVQENQKGTNVSNANPVQQIENLTQMLATVNSGAGTPFVIQDGQILATPPYLPPPPAPVEATLRAGGLDRVTSDDLLQVKGVL